MRSYISFSGRYSIYSVLILTAVLLTGYGCSNNAGDSSSQPSRVELKLLPVPKELSFSGKNFFIGDDWSIITDTENRGDSLSVQNLIEGLKEHTGLQINSIGSGNNNKGKLIRLIVRPGSVPVKSVSDSNMAAISDQAYRLKLNGSGIDLTSNAPAGLFYGIQTLLQLTGKEKRKIILPEGEITDWPDLELRIIYWDCAHHLDRMESFKRAIRQAAYFKINGFALKLEGHFLYNSAAPVVEPYAMTPEEYQELTDYAGARFVELIPYLDAPAHVSFILKHPEYSDLRAFPNSNYEFSITNPGTSNLIDGMFDELMEASKGGRYILLSTDEAYYAGKSIGEKEAARAAGSNGKLLAQFISQIAGKIQAKGRQVIFWGEYPLTAGDIGSLPQHLINGEYSRDWAEAFRKNGIRQLIYTSTQGVEPLFPNYFPLSDSLNGRVKGLINTINNSVADNDPWIMGTIVAGWGDSGLHPETFWLGYATGSAAAWNVRPARAKELTDRFLTAFYGEKITKMDAAYQLLSEQADFWDKSWKEERSALRTPVIGNSKGIYDKPRPAMDQTLPVLPLPADGTLSIGKEWAYDRQLLLSAEESLKKNDELLRLLDLNIGNADHNLYNLQVMRSAAMLCRQNLNMLIGLGQIEKLLGQSSDTASVRPDIAVELLDQALGMVKTIRDERNEICGSVTELWYHDWYPRVAEANGRKYLDQVDDIKDHLPVRTIDMSYLIYRELNYPLGKWAEELRLVRNRFAREHGVPERTEIIDWRNY